MTTTTAPTHTGPSRRAGAGRHRRADHRAAARCVRHALALAKRSLIKTSADAGGAIDVTLQPIIFLAAVHLHLRRRDRRRLAARLPAVPAARHARPDHRHGRRRIGVNLNTDIEKGVFDRFRSLPIARSAPLVGAVVADVVRYLILFVVTMSVGYSWVPGRDQLASAARGRLGISMAFALCFCWISVFVGMIARTSGAVQGIMFLLVLPLAFAQQHLRHHVDAARLAADVRQPQPDHLPGATVRGLMVGGPVAEHLIGTLCGWPGCSWCSSRWPCAPTGAAPEPADPAARPPSRPVMRGRAASPRPSWDSDHPPRTRRRTRPRPAGPGGRSEQLGDGRVARRPRCRAPAPPPRGAPPLSSHRVVRQGETRGGGRRCRRASGMSFVADRRGVPGGHIAAAVEVAGARREQRHHGAEQGLTVRTDRGCGALRLGAIVSRISVTASMSPSRTAIQPSTRVGEEQREAAGVLEPVERARSRAGRRRGRPAAAGGSARRSLKASS